jgi:uncharacterized repeat protein (TIGR02543 family)
MKNKLAIIFSGCLALLTSLTSANAQAPISVASLTINCLPGNGWPSYNIYIKASGSSYTTSDGRNGTFAYSLMNAAAGQFQISYDSGYGPCVADFNFTDALHGAYVITQVPTGNAQTGSFSISGATAPALTITAPTNGQRWSNEVFTATGQVTDDWQVGVQYQLNGGSWTAATGTTNWSASLNLLAGTNTLAVYATDAVGNHSVTNVVRFQAVVTNLMTVQMTGLGSVSPNDNNAWLEIGRNYAMTATPGTGFVFNGWTGSLTTNAATLTFMMEPDLTLVANFVDVQHPVIGITNLTAGQRWSNAVFTIKGTAADNWLVASVMYQLNGGSWTAATGTLNWSAPLSLTPGTNTLAAYAVDIAGNNSLTTNVSFQYVVTNQLQIHTTGLGAISPNYSNAWLEIGRNYSITSAPAAGFVFTNWLVSTNWIGGVAATGTNLPFMMQSNLTLSATFVETSRPTLTLTAPINLQKMSNALATAVGTASDNWQVSNVWYQLNGGAWSTGTTTNCFTNWTSTLLTLPAGTNLLKAYAVNLAGRISVTNSVSFVSSNAFKLQIFVPPTQPLTTPGLNYGLQISPGLNGHIQVSTNLATWITLTNFVGTNTTLNFHDAAATNSRQRFYRAVIP